MWRPLKELASKHQLLGWPWLCHFFWSRSPNIPPLGLHNQLNHAGKNTHYWNAMHWLLMMNKSRSINYVICSYLFKPHKIVYLFYSFCKFVFFFALKHGCNFAVKCEGDSLVWNQYSHRVDAEKTFHICRFPILFLEVLWEQHALFCPCRW